ncbi:DNA polymerase III subunit gamma/tau [Ectothiorhodospiraceae bacterium BW-2]|nr:DNA polymerase III subunit gamma/tau [Ectothiorhodospiraceae bacterium BW-2]
MSYQVLARRWRPRTFAQLVGQHHVVKPLLHGLQSGRLHHAFLFTGTRGVGKTTIARILAKALNCSLPQQGEPCGECGSCVAIDEGRFVDLLEVDAASRTKVDDTRELLDNIQYAPVHGRYKIYLIDEVHMLSRHSFNALLKTLEEPPDHIKFLLATTDPQKLPPTILSRCLQFGLQALTPEQIRSQFETILHSEQIEADAEALWELALAADGSLRDGLSLLDQAISYGGGRVVLDEVRQMLGTVGRQQLIVMLNALAEDNPAQLLQQVEQAARQGRDLRRLLNDVNRLLQQLALLQQIPDYPGIEQRQALTALSQQLSREDVQLYYQIGIHGWRDLAYSPDVRTGVEMTLLRMLAFRPRQSHRQEERRGGGHRSDDSVEPHPAPLSPPSAASPLPAFSVVAENDSQWREWSRQLRVKPMTQQLAQHCQLVACDGGRLQLQTQSAVGSLLDREEELRQGLQRLLNRPVELSLRVISADEGCAPLETPRVIEQREWAEKQTQAEAAMAADAVVERLIELFGAQLIPSSIKPLEGGDESAR